MKTRLAALAGAAIALFVAQDAVPARADLDAWTSPAKVAAMIAPCAKPVGDDPPSRALPCSRTFTDACSHANGDSTLSISSCIEAAATYWRGVVAQRTRALERMHQPVVTAYVRDSDGAWKRYLTTRCSKYRQFDGTVYEIVIAQCELDTTIQRADDLGVYAGHVTAKGVE